VEARDQCDRLEEQIRADVAFEFFWVGILGGSGLIGFDFVAEHKCSSIHDCSGHIEGDLWISIDRNLDMQGLYLLPLGDFILVDEGAVGGVVC
jgi:hypothetical protein